MTTIKELIEDLQENFKPEDEVLVEIIDISQFADNLKEEYGVTLPLEVWKEAINEVEVDEDTGTIYEELGELIETKLKALGIELKELEA
jgi:hypothetical protein